MPLCIAVVGTLGFVSVERGLSAGVEAPADYSALATPRLDISLHRGHLAINGHAVSRGQEQEMLRQGTLLFPQAQLSAEFRPLGTAPDFWTTASSAALLALSAARSGNAQLTDKALRIRGVSTTDWSEHAAKLRGKLPKQIVLDVDMLAVAGTPPADTFCRRAFASFNAGAINFEEGTTVLRRSARPAIDRAIALADSCRRSRIAITGHTDSSGPEEWNSQLSLLRAEAVAAALADGGIARGRLHAVGKGSAEPLVSNASRYGRSLNRRIEIRFQPDGSGDP